MYLILLVGVGAIGAAMAFELGGPGWARTA